MTFLQAIRETKAEGCCAAGMGALAARDRDALRCEDPRRLTGSVNLDEALKVSEAGEARWDYGISLRPAGRAEGVVWLEVHPARGGAVEEVIAKKDWLVQWLRANPSVNAFERVFVWVATKGVPYPRNSRQQRLLRRRGISMHAFGRETVERAYEGEKR